MQNNNTESNVDQLMINIKRVELLKKVTIFFFTYTGKAIEENSNQLKFWHRAILETKLMDDPEHRMEFERIVQMNEELSLLSLKLTQNDVTDLLSFLDGCDANLRMQVLAGLEADRKEVANA